MFRKKMTGRSDSPAGSCVFRQGTGRESMKARPVPRTDDGTGQVRVSAGPVLRSYSGDETEKSESH